MTETEKNEIIAQIEEQREAINEEITHLKEVTRPIKLDASIGRVSRMDAINNKAINDMALRDKKKTLQKLERALERVEAGIFGSCMKCGKPIPFGRLKIMPYTMRCVTCA